jgi:hypothetical protein
VCLRKTLLLRVKDGMCKQGRQDPPPSPPAGHTRIRAFMQDKFQLCTHVSGGGGGREWGWIGESLCYAHQACPMHNVGTTSIGAASMLYFPRTDTAGG